MNLSEFITEKINYTVIISFLRYVKNLIVVSEPQLCFATGNMNDIYVGRDDLKSMSIPQKQRKWVREEVVLLVAEYFRTRDMSSIEKSESVELVSKILRKRAIINDEAISEKYRNINGIKMQFGCIRGLDPVEAKRGRYGLSGASKLQKEVVEEYLENPNKIKREAAEVFMKYL